MLYFWDDSDTASVNRVVRQHFIQQNEAFSQVNKLEHLSQMKAGDVALIAGKPALSWLQEHGLAAKNKSINAMRGQPVQNPVGGGVVLMAYSAAMTNYDYARKSDILWDVQLAVRLHNTGTVMPNVGKYRYVQDFSDVIARVKELFEATGKPVKTAFDLETMGLVPYDRAKRIISISITVEEGMADVYYFNENHDQPAMPVYHKDGHVKGHKVRNEKLFKQLKWLMLTDKISGTGANLKFDENWTVEKWGLWFSNFKFDTTLVGSLIDENRSNSLNMHAKIYTEMGGYDDEFNSTYDKAHMEDVPKSDLLGYAGGDTDACLRVRGKLQSQLLKDKALARFYTQLLHPAARVFAKLESRGMLVDVGEYEKLKVRVTDEVARLEREIFNLMPNRLKLKYADNLSLGRNIILQEFLFTPKGLNLTPQMYTAKAKDESFKYASTSMEHFEMFEDVPEAKQFVDLMREYNSATKTLSTYIIGFMSHVRQDGRFHPSYMLHHGDYGKKDSGTVTGRLSAKDPAFQTIPKHTIWAKPLRKVYIAPPGYVVLNVDFSQGELRVAACVANELNMIEAYRQGIDVHLKTGLHLYNLQHPEDQLTLGEAIDLKKHGDARIKAARQGGKAGNFGLLYGMQAAGFQNYARKTYGVIMQMSESEEFRDGFFEMYPALPGWHEEYANFAHEHGYVRSPLGRIRHLPLINSHEWGTRSKQERQAINSPIQSTLSDLALLAMVEIDRQYPDLWLFGMTHDSISMYVPEDQGLEWAARITQLMENLPLAKFNWHPQLSFPADAELGPNLADVEELDLAA